MKKQGLKKIGDGFYVDLKGSVYFDMNEFIACHNIPNHAETKAAVWEEVKKQFGTDSINLLEE
jgi:hypothetical protein